MRRKIILDWEAEAEAEAARQWYAQKNPAAAKRFVAALRAAMRLMTEDPERWAEFEPGVRRVMLRKFPYAVIYTLEPDRVLVLAVMHFQPASRVLARPTENAPVSLTDLGTVPPPRQPDVTVVPMRALDIAEDRDADDPEGLIAWSRRYVDDLRVKGYSERTLVTVHGNLALFAEWAFHRGITRPTALTKAIIEHYQRALYHARKHDDRARCRRNACDCRSSAASASGSRSTT